MLYPLSYVGLAGTLDCTPELTTADVPHWSSSLGPSTTAWPGSPAAVALAPRRAGHGHRDSTIGRRQVRRPVTEKS